ncbi:MAG TPA: helix-turn-helix domain-containing protein [Mycobacteriales bacterium]|nr:helix-turn-helix domain-containing protein [Mycobacteriales bacterium]
MERADPIDSPTHPGTGSGGDRLTVRDLLAEPKLAACQVLSGADRLDGPLTWCLPLSEAAGPDRLDGVGVHAYTADLLTHGRGAATAVRDLAARGAAALLLSGEVAGLAAAGITADTAPIPMVRLPPSAGFGLVNRVVAEKSLAQAAHALEYGVTVHRTLGELLYRGAGLPALGRQISRLSRCPAFVLGPHGEVLVYEYIGTAAVPDPSEVLRLLGETGLATAPAGTAEHDPDPTGDPTGTTRVDVVCLALEDGPVRCVVAPIVLGRIRHGWIVVVELAEPPARHDLARHRVIAEQAVTIVGSEMLRLRSVEEAKERARGDFVHALLHGRFTDPHDLLARAGHHEFDLDGCYAVLALGGFGPTGPTGPNRGVELARLAGRVRPEPGVRTLTTVAGDVLVVIRQLTPGRATPAERLAEFARALSTEAAARLGRPVRVTHGRPGTGAKGIAASYREARIALGVCERLDLHGVSGYDELRVFAVLGDIAATAAGRSFATEILAPLRTRAAAGADLQTAVIAYVEAGGNLNAAARTLSLHRNTMLYKVERASRLLGLDLRDAEARHTVWLAHRIAMLGEIQSALTHELNPAG